MRDVTNLSIVPKCAKLSRRAICRRPPPGCGDAAGKVVSGYVAFQKSGFWVLRYFPWLGYEGRLSLPATKYNMVTR